MADYRERPALAPTGGIELAPLKYSPLRVMVVDDNRDASDSLGTLLRMVGFVTRIHHNAPSALAELEEFAPEACILDLSMPVMDGCQMAEQLRQRSRGADMLLVAVTALDSAEATSRTRAAGFDRHLVKPANPQTLLDILFDYERRRRMPDDDPNPN